MASRRQDVRLEGAIEMNAAWFGGKVRKKNKLADQKLKGNDRRAAEHRRGERVIMVVQQRGGSSLMFAADGEIREIAVAVARELVKGVSDLEPGQRLRQNLVAAESDNQTRNHARARLTG